MQGEVLKREGRKDRQREDTQSEAGAVNCTLREEQNVG